MQSQLKYEVYFNDMGVFVFRWEGLFASCRVPKISEFMVWMPAFGTKRKSHPYEQNGVQIREWQ